MLNNDRKTILPELNPNFFATVVFGLAALGFNVLNRFFPRSKPSDNAAIPQESRPDRAAQSTISSIIFSALTMVSFFAALYFSHQWGAIGEPAGPKGDTGPQGAPGSIGPPGPPGPPPQTSDITQLKPIIEAISRKVWLEEMRTGFEGGFAQWSISEKDRLATYLEIMKRNDPTGHQHSPASIPTPDNALRHIARITLNKDLNLTLHPNFDRNNHIPTPGADDIPSAFDQEEYRREYDVYNTAMGTLNGIKTDLDSKIRENERIISQFVESENR